MGNTQRISGAGVPLPSLILLRVLIAVVATAVALLLTGLLAPLLGGAYFLLALAAVALSTLYAGQGAGLLTTLLAVLGFCYFFFPPIGSFRVDEERNVLRLAVFVGSAALVSWVCASVRQSLVQTKAQLEETERADRELRAANARTVELLESTSDAFLSIDRNSHFIYLNGVAERLLGRKREELVGRSLWMEFPELVGSSFQREYQQALDTGRPAQFVEFSTRLQAWLEVRAFPSRSGLSVFFRDITERRNAEEELRQSEERFRLLIDGVKDYAIFALDTEGRITSWNPGAERLKGWRAEEIIGQHFSRFYPPEDVQRGRPEAELKTAVATGRYEEEGCRVRKDGTHFWAHVLITSLWDKTGTLRGFAKVTRDVTERHAAEEALRESERRYRLLASNYPDGMVALYDRNLRYLLVEGRGLAEVGLSKAKMEGRTIWELLPPETCAVMEEPMRAVFAARGQNAELTYAGKTYRAHYLPVRNEAGEVMAGMLMTQNITELKALQEQLEQRVRERTTQLTEVNRELEAFSSSVSHDLRAPLRRIDGFCQAVEDDAESTLSPAARGYLLRVRRASERMAQLIDDLLSLSRLSRVEPRRTRVDVTKLAHEVVAELAAREPQRSVEVRLGPGLQADADPRLLRVVLENLLGNAWKFTSRVERPLIELSAAIREGETVYCVRDNGAGFDMAYADSLFAPFQRLHDEKEFPGTGVGLATVQRVVHRHGGRIWAESAPDQGAAFFFTLRG